MLFLGIGYSVLGTDLGVTGSLRLYQYKLPVIRATSENDRTAFRSNTYRNKIKIINLEDEINPPNNIIASWDIGVAQNGNVMAYLTPNQSDNSYYDLYIQGDGHLYANVNSGYLFNELRGVDQINGLDNLDTTMVKSMNSMFNSTGYSSSVFTLDLGNNFDTSNVTNMSSMFNSTGHDSTAFTLDLGEKFDTSNVTTMYSMFSYTGLDSTAMTLDLGDKFDTSNVMIMDRMFYYTGKNSPVFTLNLGNKFDTSNVTNMEYMFYFVGTSSTVFTLDLGDKFDTSKVYSMRSMFGQAGANSSILQ